MNSTRPQICLAAPLKRRLGCRWLLLWCIFGSVLPDMVSAQARPPATVTERKQTVSPLVNHYLKTRWTTEEGLPQNSVDAILQTRDGYLWLGTLGGLGRFDGVKFTIFNSSNTPALRSNRIRTLFEDRAGTLWVGLENGDVTGFKDGVVKTYTTSDGLPGGIIWSIYEDRAGGLWIGSAKGLARFEAGRFTAYQAQEGLPGGSVFSICEDQTGRLWLLTQTALVHFEAGKFTAYTPPDVLALRTYLCASRDGSLWLNTARGLTRFRDGNFTTYPLAAAGLNNGNIRTIVADREGGIWASYFGGFIRHWKDGDFSLHTLQLDSEERGQLYVDREHNLWLGTNGNGLFRFKPRRLTAYATQDGLPSDSVRAVTDDGAGGLWISTYSGLVHLLTSPETKLTTYTTKDGLPGNILFALHRDRQGSLWIGGEGTLTQFKDGKFKAFSAVHGLASNFVHAIAEDGDGNLWVGTEGGLHRFRDGRFTIYRQADGLVHDDVRFILPARDGSLWLSIQ